MDVDVLPAVRIASATALAGTGLAVPARPYRRQDDAAGDAGAASVDVRGEASRCWRLVGFHEIEYAVPCLRDGDVKSPPAPVAALGFGTSAPAVSTVR